MPRMLCLVTKDLLWVTTMSMLYVKTGLTAPCARTAGIAHSLGNGNEDPPFFSIVQGEVGDALCEPF